jgi:hypothetical protein
MLATSLQLQAAAWSCSYKKQQKQPRAAHCSRMAASLPAAVVQLSHFKGGSANWESTTQQLQQPEQHSSQGPPAQAEQPPGGGGQLSKGARAVSRRATGRRAPIQPSSALAGLLTVTATLLVKRGQLRVWRMCQTDVQPPLKQRCQQQAPSWVTARSATLGWQLMQLWSR